MVYVVTGATSGIGKQIALDLCKDRHTVIGLYGHNADQAKKVENEFKKKKYAFETIKCDVANESEVKAAFSQIKKKYKHINGLINNAGTAGVDANVEDYNLEDYMHIVNTNYIGKMLCAKHAIPLLKKQKNANIINIASRMGTRGDTECSAYCCSAAAIIMLTKCLALELSAYNIRVNTVSPGFTPTPLALSSWKPEDIADMEKKNPCHRNGKVEDISNAVMFLLSDKAEYINGENLDVNGGILLK